METSAKTANNVNGALRTRPAPRLRHALTARRCGFTELFYEIARKLPKTAPVTAPASGLVLTDKAPLKKKSQCCA